MIGLSALRLAVLPRDADDALAKSVQRWLGGALALLTLASLGILVSRTLALNGGAWSTRWPDMRLALGATHFGHVWLWRVPALLLAWAAWAVIERYRRARPLPTTPSTVTTGTTETTRTTWPTWLIALAVAGIAMTRSSTGHAADHGDFTIAVWVDWLHLLAAGAWVGSLFGMSLAVFPAILRLEHQANRVGAEVFQRLSTLSGAALALLLACGVYNAVIRLDRFADLWTTAYGLTLDVKLGLVLVMVAIGAHNRYVKLPRLLRQAGRRPRSGPVARIVRAGTGRKAQAADAEGAAALRDCSRAVRIEALLGLAVIGATAVLIHSMPPVDAHRMHEPMGSMPSHPPG